MKDQAPIHDRMIPRQEVAVIETSRPYAPSEQQVVVRKWETLPPAERMETNAERRKLKETHRVGPRMSHEITIVDFSQ